jgi:hypothetical protein
MKLDRLIKTCLNEAYRRVCISKHLSEGFLVRNCLKQRDALSPLLFNFSSEYATLKVQEIQVGLKLNGTRQLLAYADDVNLLGDNGYYKKTEKTLIDVSKEVGSEINVKRTMFMLLSRHKNVILKSGHKNSKHVI